MVTSGWYFLPLEPKQAAPFGKTGPTLVIVRFSSSKVRIHCSSAMILLRALNMDLWVLPRYDQCMAHQDARSLSSEAQEDLRRRVIQAVLTQGMRKAHAARTFGVSRQAINNRLAAHQRGGDAALAAKKRGRPKERTIAPKQQAKIVRAIQGKCPDQLKLPFALWTREAVVELTRRIPDVRSQSGRQAGT